MEGVMAEPWLDVSPAGGDAAERPSAQLLSGLKVIGVSWFGVYQFVFFCSGKQNQNG